MLPGQLYETRRSTASGAMPEICFFKRSLNFAMKCSTSSGMSSRRSRSGGRWIGTTFSR